MTDNKRLIKLRSLRNKLITLGISDEVNNLEEMFPELKMDSIDEDENTKNELFKHLKEGAEGYEPAGSSEDYAKWLDWLEKQFKQIHYTSDAPIGQTATGEVVYIEDVKSTKPNFERGCWITNGRYVKLIVGIGTKGDMPYYYMFKDGTTKYIDEIDKKWHIWSINDAKDGDIIAFNIDEDLNHKWIGIFKERPNEDLYDNKYCTCKFHCLINFINEEPEFEIGGVWNVDITDVQPASKEERDTLFAKIKEESLMWDDINKVLIVVKQTNTKFNVDDIIQYNGLGHNEYVIKEVHYPTHYINELSQRMDMFYTDAHFTYIGHINNSEDNRHEWSEEDEEFFNDTITFLKNSKNALDHVDWLKSLKCRVQQKQEWGEEDERNASYICAALDCYYRLREESNNTNGQENLDKARNWLYNKLKFIRPQNTLKLSDDHKKLTDVNHEYFSELLENNNSKDINDYAYQVAYCMSHDWAEETATWDDVQKACKLGAEWNEKHHKSINR